MKYCLWSDLFVYGSRSGVLTEFNGLVMGKVRVLESANRHHAWRCAILTPFYWASSFCWSAWKLSMPRNSQIMKTGRIANEPACRVADSVMADGWRSPSRDVFQTSPLNQGKGKVKCILVQALRLCTGRTAHRGSRDLALPFHEHGCIRWWGVSVTPRPFITPEKDPVRIVQEAGWVPGPVWTGAENLAPHRDSILGPSSP